MYWSVQGDNVSRNRARFVKFQCDIRVVRCRPVLSAPVGIRDTCKFVAMMRREVKETLENIVIGTVEGNAMGRCTF